MKAYLWKTFAKDNRIRGTKNEKGEAAYLLGWRLTRAARSVATLTLRVDTLMGRFKKVLISVAVSYQGWVE